jgi:hypothetical protein
VITTADGRRRTILPLHRDEASMSIDPRADEAPARLLALILAAGGCDDAQAIRRLDELGAFARIGVGRGRFVDLIGTATEEGGTRLCDCSWLRDSDEAHIERLALPIEDPHLRLLVCRLAAAVLGSDDSVANNRRLVLDHVLARWHFDPTQITPADNPPREGARCR